MRANDGRLIADYLGGDIYHAFAYACGITKEPDRKIWKSANVDQRQHMKQLQLAINYGMGVKNLARGLQRHPLIASAIILMHQQRYPDYWRWRAEELEIAMLTRRIESSYSWPLRISTSPNQRSLYNFPCQSDGAEMLRLAAVQLCEAGLVPSMLIHDGILLELDNHEQIEQAKEIMRNAGRTVCNGLEIGVDTDQLLEHGARYRDKRDDARLMWETIMTALEDAGALKRRA
jgi:hypothetical protein